MRSNTLALAMMAAACAPASSSQLTISAPTPSTTLPDLKRRQRRPSKFERESRRGSRPLRAKDGASHADAARRERAEAKRNRKAQQRLATGAQRHEG